MARLDALRAAASAAGAASKITGASLSSEGPLLLSRVSEMSPGPASSCWRPRPWDQARGMAGETRTRERGVVASRRQQTEITDKVPLGFKPVTPAQAGGSLLIALFGVGVAGSAIYVLVSEQMRPQEDRVYGRREYRPENQPGRVGSSYPPKL